MADSGYRGVGFNVDVKPHAYDPIAQPELFDGVLARRVLAFFIDVTIIAIPVIFAAIFIFMFGIHGCPARFVLEAAHGIDSTRFQLLANHLDSKKGSTPCSTRISFFTDF